MFQFDANGALIAPSKIWSNEELQPQLSSTLLGTYYLVTFYDQNGSRLNVSPMWWQFPEVAGSTVDISQITPISTIGGNILFYPTNFAGGTGSVTSVGFVGDGIIFSTTPSTPVTTSGNIFPTLLTQNANTVFSGPPTGIAATPTFRLLVAADLPIISASNLSNGVTGSGTIVLAASPTISGTLLTSAITASGLIIARANIQLGVSGTLSGVVTLEGATSGTSTITGPAVAGTITNPILFSNAISIPTGTTYQINGVQISATNLSNGVTGTGSIVLAASPTITGTLNTSAIIATTLTVTAATPTGAASTVSFGTTTATSATAGTNGDVPAQVVGYLTIDIAGTKFKIPYYNV